MTTEPVERLVSKLAVPTIISMLVTAFYNMADTFFVGMLDNTSATGAVGVVFSFMAVLQACGFFFGQGSGNYVSRLLGQRRVDDAERIVAIGLFSALIVGTVIAVSGLILLEPLARVLGSTDTILPYAKSYLGVILLGAPFMIASYVLNNLMRFQGNAFYSMIGIGIGAVLNVILDPICIFTLGLGVTGAAVATVFSQFVSFCILLFCCTRGDNLRVHIRLFRPRLQDYQQIVRGGLPTLCRQGLSSLSTISLNFVAGEIGGDPAIAAMSVATRVIWFGFSAMIGFGQGFQPVCGFNYGAGLYSRVKRAFWFCVKTSSVVLVLISATVWWLAPQLIGLFTSDPQVLDIGILSLRLQCISFPLISWITMSNMMMQNIGLVGRASFLSMARQGIFFIPLVLGLPMLLSALGGEALLGLQLAQPLADVITFAVTVPLCVGVLRKMNIDRPVSEE